MLSGEAILHLKINPNFHWQFAKTNCYGNDKSLPVVFEWRSTNQQLSIMLQMNFEC